jgi:Carboxypeptidase regulatory-like domain/TonB dependent receptor
MVGKTYESNYSSHRSAVRASKTSWLASGTAALITMLVIVSSALLLPGNAKAQTAGEGTIAGSITDSTGAVIPNAVVTATNVTTGLATRRTTTSAGIFTITPLLPGTYTVEVSASGFRGFKQENLAVNALNTVNLNPVLEIGGATETVTVSTAPPQLNTDSAVLGTVMENTTYSNLPLLMSTVTFAQRDPTAFASLTTGTQASTSSLRPAIVGGMGNNLQIIYLDGVPAETVNQQGDTRLVGLNVSVDAIDQFQVITSIPAVEYAGAGALNFTMKSGGKQYHGQISDYVRNTIFDSWSFTNKWVPKLGSTLAQCVASANRSLCQNKPFEHQNEFSASIGGKVPFTHEKLFFFVAYDLYHGNGPGSGSPAFYTVPTALMRQGDFTELNGGAGSGGVSGTGSNNPAIIFDPRTNTCAGAVCTRQAFQGIKNGLPTNNVIPAGYISPIAQSMQSFLPAPSDPTTVSNNYIGTRVAGNDNHLTDFRVDYDLTQNHRISGVGAIGVNHFLNNYGAPFLPLPYVGGDLASVFPKQFDVEDAYTFSPRLVNQFKYGYTRFYMDIHDATDGVHQYQADTLGITNLPTPTGQATTDFPTVTFGATAGITPSITNWKSGASAATTITSPATFSIIDNVSWIKGRHAMTFGGTFLFMQVKNAGPRGPTGLLTLPYNAISTAGYAPNSSALASAQSASAGGGYSYASFLLGAVGGSPTIALQPLVQQIDSRYKAFAPYFSDTWKLNSKLTLDLGLRWDYMQPYHELKNHFTFMNPNQTNPSTNTLGALQFAGNGDSTVFCNCKTPVQTDWKNYSPRVGLAYSVNQKLVVRAGAAILYTFGGGTGGGRTNGGGGLGAGQSLGYSTTATTTTPEITSGASAGPAFYLNTSSAYLGSAANSALGLTYPPTPTSSTLASEANLNAGNYLNSAGAVVTPSSLAYEDPVRSGQPPEFTMYNLGIQQALTQDLTMEINYVGNQAHHVFEVGAGGNVRGYWVNQLNPAYLLALGGVTGTNASGASVPILTAPATSANVAKARAASALALPMPGGDSGYFVTAANAKPSTSSLTVAQALVAFPQYSGVTDGWGSNVENFSYNSLQVTMIQRTRHGLTFNGNYTWSRNIGDDGSFRSGFALPSGIVDGTSSSFGQNRIDRGVTTIAQTHVFNLFGLYQIPLGGRGQLLGENPITRALLGGWSISGIYQAATGTPIAVTSNHCTSTPPNAGTCMPSLNPNGSSARVGGAYGSGPGGTIFSNLNSVLYVAPTAFAAPADLSTLPSTAHQFKFGNAPRTAPFGLRNPGVNNVNASIRRAFPMWRETSLVFEASVQNAFNRVQFNGPNATGVITSVSAAGVPTYSSTFGQISGIANQPRSWQLAGHINF